MDKKIRMIVTFIEEYVPNPKYYPEGSTIEDMAQLDVDNIIIDTEMFVDRVLSGKGTMNIDYEIVDG